MIKLFSFTFPWAILRGSEPIFARKFKAYFDPYDNYVHTYMGLREAFKLIKKISFAALFKIFTIVGKIIDI